MNLEEYKKYVIEVNNSIENLLKNNEEELNFYQLLVKTFNQVCEERNNLEQALDEIEKYINESPSIKYASVEKINGKRLSGKLIPVDDLLEIINIAKERIEKAEEN